MQSPHCQGEIAVDQSKTLSARASTTGALGANEQVLAPSRKKKIEGASLLPGVLQCRRCHGGEVLVSGGAAARCCVRNADGDSGVRYPRAGQKGPNKVRLHVQGGAERRVQGGIQ